MTLPPWRIVIADDNTDDRADVRRLLLRGSERRIAFVEADTGARGVAACLPPNEPADCLILDFNLPDADAVGVLEQLRGKDGGTQLPVIVLTGSTSERPSAVLRAGAQDYLGKGWMGPESLTRAIENAIERWKLARDLRESEERLQAADRAKDEFLATLAHELRNPLAPIRNGVAVLRHSAARPEVTERMLTIIERQLGHMVHLIDDLLDVSRISRGKIVLQRQRASLAEIVRDAVEASRPLIDASGHALNIAIADGDVVVDVDVTRIAQVVTNLLNNAAKYTPHGGRIDLVVDSAEGNARVSVTDTGVGISEAMLPKVFDMFTQVDASRDRAQGGLGIGLAIAQRLVDLHGGELKAASAGEGQGSRFTVRLPLALREGAAAKADGGGASSSKRRILIVDDNVDAAASMAMLLELRGHEVRMVHDALAAVSNALAFEPQTVLLDIGLPQIDGYEVARRLRAEPKLAGIKVVALTGFGSADDKRATRAASFDGHLVKPIALDALEACLDGC